MIPLESSAVQPLSGSGSSRVRPGSWLLRMPRWMQLVVLGCVAYISFFSLIPRSPHLVRLGGIGYAIIVQALCVMLLLRAGRRLDFPRAMRDALRLLAAGWISVGFATVLVFLSASHGSGGPVPGGSLDILYIAAYPLMLGGLLRLPRAPGPVPGPWRVLLDSAVFILGVGVPLWVFAILPALGKVGGFEFFLAVTYPALAFVGMILLNAVLLRSAPFPNRPAFNLIMAGLAVTWLSDLVFSLQVTQNIFPTLAFLNNAINMVSLLLTLLGAWRLQRDPVPAHPARPAPFSPVPMFTILLVALWLWRLLWVAPLDSGTLRKIMVGMILLFLVLLLRETLAMKDSLRQATESVTQAFRARLEALVRNSSDLILVTAADGQVSFASPAATHLFGIPAEEMEGMRLLDFVHGDDSAAVTAFLDDLALDSGRTGVQQWRMRHADGHWHMFETSGSNLLRDPSVHGLVLNARDISDRHHLQDQLRQAQKMEAVGRLAGGVAHDFNNLLSAILGNVELAMEVLPAATTVDNHLRRIHGAATRGADLTGRLLAFSRRESPDPQVIQPERLVQGILPLMEGVLGENIRLFMAPHPAGLGAIRVNPADLEQGLLNLAANARDAMPAGGTLTVALRAAALEEPQEMEYLFPPPGPFVVIEVADTGSGIDESIRLHLFEPFFTTKGRGKGTGLGLTAVYGMLKAAQGGIAVRSRPGQGTTFELWFPQVDGPVSRVEQPAEVQPAPSLLGTETILLVEDEEDVREALERILRSKGYTVHSARNAEEARQFLQGHDGPLDLLLTDVIMPGDSGPRLAAELVKLHAQLRVLYISGYTADELGPHGLARPDAPLLGKPFTTAELGQRLREVMEGPPGRI